MLCKMLRFVLPLDFTVAEREQLHGCGYVRLCVMCVDYKIGVLIQKWVAAMAYKLYAMCTLNAAQLVTGYERS